MRRPTLKDLFYNTAGESAKTVILNAKINKGQDTHVLKIIKTMGDTFTCWQVWSIYNKVKDIAITDVRRSINSLKNANFIEETGFKPVGIKKRKVLQYKLSN